MAANFRRHPSQTGIDVQGEYPPHRQIDAGRAAGAARTAARKNDDDDGLCGGGGNAGKFRNECARKQRSLEFEISHATSPI